MKPLARHHHFRLDAIPPGDRIAHLELYVLNLLLTTGVPDARRDSSIAWEIKHQAGVVQCARILAAKRGLDPEVAAAGALLHDIATIVTGSYEDHARRGEAHALNALSQVGSFLSDEQEQVLRIVVNHSDKDKTSQDPWVEFGKDVDVLDCFLYPNALDEYILTKPLPKVKHYLLRAQRVWQELGLPIPTAFHMLDDFDSDTWMTRVCRGLPNVREAYHSLNHRENPAPFALWLPADGPVLATTHRAVAREVPESGRGGDDLKHLDQSGLALFWPAIGRYQVVARESDLARYVTSAATKESGVD